MSMHSSGRTSTRVVAVLTRSALALHRRSVRFGQQHHRSDDRPTQTTRTFNQVQRLGNPLVSEVFLAKRDHPFHGSIGPADDAAAFGAQREGIRRRVPAAGDDAAEHARVGAAAGHADRSDGQGGVHRGLAERGRSRTARAAASSPTTSSTPGSPAIFSDLLDPTQSVCKPGALPLCTDNVGIAQHVHRRRSRTSRAPK